MGSEADQIEKILSRRKNARARLSLSYMSDTKWARALTALAEKHPGLHCTWKLVGNPEPCPGHLPIEPPLRQQSHLDDGWLLAPFFLLPNYSDVEWLEVPARARWQPHPKLEPVTSTQDIQSIAQTLEAVGSLELEATETHLRLYGYRP